MFAGETGESVPGCDGPPLPSGVVASGLAGVWTGRVPLL